MHKYDGQNCINTAPFVAQGSPPCAVDKTSHGLCDHHHHFERNRCIVLYTDVYGANIGGCPPDFTPGTTSFLADNKYYSPTAGNASISCLNHKIVPLTDLQKLGLEKGSTSEALPPSDLWHKWAQETLNLTLPMPAS